MNGTQELKCDFCAKAPPSRVYPCQDFAVLMKGLPPQGSKGPFMACSACAAFVDAKDVKGLVKRYSSLHHLPHSARPTRKKLLLAYWGKFFELHEPGRAIDPAAVFDAHVDNAAIELACKIVTQVREGGELKLARCDNKASLQVLLKPHDAAPRWADACSDCARDTLELEDNVPLEQHERIRSLDAGKDERTKS